MDGFLQPFLETIGGQLPAVLAALGILIGGWLLALIGAALTRGLLGRAQADHRLSRLLGQEEETPPVRVTLWASRLVYYFILLFVLIGFLQALNLSAVAEPIQHLVSQVLTYLPQLAGAAALLLVAWVLASALRFLLTRVLAALKVDERLASRADLEAPQRETIGATLGNVAYWLVFLLFLPGVLDALGLQGLLAPVQGVVDQILGVLPNLLGAGLILLLGWIGARIVRQIAANLLHGLGLDRLGDQTGLAAALGGQRLSQVVGTIVYVLVLIPVVIAALNTLQIAAVSEPAAGMLATILNALPALFGAFLLIGVAYLVARVVSTFITNVLTGIGFNRVLSWIGLRETAVEGTQTPSQIVGHLAAVAIMLFAVIEAAELLGFAILAVLVSDFLLAAGGVLLGLVIFGLGLYLAGLADQVIRSTGARTAGLLAPVARVAIIVFAGALALRQTGIAQDIVNLAFGLILGALAFAAALAFGLGSRELAGRELARWIEGQRKTPSA